MIKFNQLIYNVMKKYLLLFALFIFSVGFAQKSATFNNNIQINDKNESYSYKANFNASKTSVVRQTITKEFGEPKSNDTDLVWTWNGSYEISLREGGVNINFGKSNDNDELYQKVKNLGNKISSALK